MYLAHFGLDRSPFRITPNTAVFFPGAKRGPTLEALSFALLREEGIVQVGGEVGTGKTMLCRMLLARLPESVDTLYLANPSLGPEDLLRMIAGELRIEAVPDNPGALLLEIQRVLIERFAAGRRVVALVDEAHAMPAASLEQIRLLSNLETDEHKLLQIVLFGQPELDEILARRSMRQLRDRITHHFRLEPLGPREVGAYLDFRLRAAGYRGPALFGAAAVRLLARASCGLSRRINVLADKAMLSAYSQGDHRIGRHHVVAAIRDSEFPVPPRWSLWVAGACAAGALALAGAGMIRQARPIDPDTVRAEAPADPAPRPTRPPDLRESTPLASPSGRSPETVAAPAPPVAPGPAAGPADLASPEAAATPPTPPPAAAAPEPAVPQAREVPSGVLGPRSSALHAGTPAWVRSRPDEHWFIQLRTVDGGRTEDIERVVEESVAQLGDKHLRIYVRDLGWGQRVGLIYGDYARKADVLEALRTLPAPLRSAGAYPRQIKGLR